MNCSPEVRWWRQHEVAGGTCTCLGNSWRPREPHAGSTDSGRAEPGGLGDPPRTHQTPHRGHMGAGRRESYLGEGCRDVCTFTDENRAKRCTKFLFLDNVALILN